MGTGHTGLPEIDFNGDLENLGATAYSVPRGRLSQTFQVLDNFTLIHGHNTYKFGGEFHRYDVQSFNDNLERGLLDVNTCFSLSDGTCPALSSEPIVNELANFYIGNIYALGNTGNTQRFTFNNNLGFFAQDEIRVRPNLTVIGRMAVGIFFSTCGKAQPAFELRRKRQPGASGIAHLAACISPRPEQFRAAPGDIVESAWNTWLCAPPTACTTITSPQNISDRQLHQLRRCGDQSVHRHRQFHLRSRHGQDFNGTVWNGSATGPIYTPTVYTQSIFVTERNFRTPYVQSWNLNIQRQFNQSLAFEIGYVGTKGTALTRLYDANQDFTNENYYQVAVLSTGANSTYNALQTTLRLKSTTRCSSLAAAGAEPPDLGGCRCRRRRDGSRLDRRAGQLHVLAKPDPHRPLPQIDLAEVMLVHQYDQLAKLLEIKYVARIGRRIRHSQSPQSVVPIPRKTRPSLDTSRDR